MSTFLSYVRYSVNLLRVAIILNARMTIGRITLWYIEVLHVRVTVI